MSEINLSKEVLANRIKFQDLDGQIKEFDPKELLAIHRSKLGSDIEDEPTQYFTLMRVVNKVLFKLRDVKQKQQWLYGYLYNQYVNDKTLIKMNHNRKPTDAMIRSKIMTNNKYYKISKIVNLIHYYYSDLYDLSSAMQDRKDLIQTYSAQIRQEKQD